MSSSISGLNNAQNLYAEVLLKSISTGFQSGMAVFSSSGSATGAGTSAINDASAINEIVNLSGAAMEALHAQTTASSAAQQGSAVTGASMETPLTPQDAYASALTNAFNAIEGLGSTTTFTFSNATGTSNAPVITGSMAGQLTNAVSQAKTALASGAAPQTANNPIDNFAQIYAQQAADGVAGRFYKETDVNQFTAGMSDSTKTSFMQAYNNHTLDIQSANKAAGVISSGSSTTTFNAGAAGGGEALGGNGSINVTALTKTNQYARILYDPFFGAAVVSWGGAPSASQST